MSTSATQATVMQQGLRQCRLEVQKVRSGNRCHSWTQAASDVRNRTASPRGRAQLVGILAPVHKTSQQINLWMETRGKNDLQTSNRELDGDVRQDPWRPCCIVFMTRGGTPFCRTRGSTQTVKPGPSRVPMLPHTFATRHRGQIVAKRSLHEEACGLDPTGRSAKSPGTLDEKKESS